MYITALIQYLAHGKPTIDSSYYVILQETEVIFSLIILNLPLCLLFIEQVLQPSL